MGIQTIDWLRWKFWQGGETAKLQSWHDSDLTADNIVFDNGTALVTGTGDPASSGASLTRIAESTLAAPAASVLFSGIPATYRDLIVVASARTDNVSTGPSSLEMRLNSSSAADYDYQTFNVNNTTITSTGAVAAGQSLLRVGYVPRTGDTADKWGYTKVEISDYASTTKDKVVAARSVVWTSEAAAGSWQRHVSGVWRPATIAAVNDVTLLSGVENFVAGSKFALYGIK